MLYLTYVALELWRLSKKQWTPENLRMLHWKNHHRYPYFMWTVIPVHKAFSPYLGLQVEHIFKHSFLIMLHMLNILYQVLLRILWCRQSGHHLQNNLAKFGYILDMKVEKKQNLTIFLAAYWNLIIKTGNLKKKPFQTLANLGHFFPCIGWNHIFKETWLYGLSWLFINQGPCPSSGMFLFASRKFLVWINACWSRRSIGTHITCESCWLFTMAFSHTSRSKLKWPMYRIVL